MSNSIPANDVVFSQVPIFDRIITYLNGKDLTSFITITPNIFKMFSIPSYNQYIFNKIQEYLKQKREKRRNEELARLNKESKELWESNCRRYGGFTVSLFSLMTNQWTDVMIMGGGNKKIHKKDNIKDNIKVNNIKMNNKVNAKHNRILQNQIYKKQQKR
jgi:hypothetical protein